MRVVDSINAEWYSRDYLRERRFGDDTLELVLQSGRRALARGVHGRVPASILLWTLMRWEKTSGVAALQRAGVDVVDLERGVEECLNRHEWVEPRVMDMGDIGAIVDAAVMVARRQEHNYVATEHLIVALLECNDTCLQALFARGGLTVDRYMGAVKALTDPKN